MDIFEIENETTSQYFKDEKTIDKINNIICNNLIIKHSLNLCNDPDNGC